MKSVIVTGHSRGLGSEIVRALLRDTDYHVIGLSRKKTDITKKLEQEYPSQFTHLEFDLSRLDQIKPLFLNTISAFGPVYGLVNNAAVAYDDLASNIQETPLKAMFDVNVFAAMLMTKYTIRNMLLHKTPGSIVFISSISAHTGYKGLSMYASTKGAIEAFSKGIAREWGWAGIRSNCVVPGFMETEMTRALSDEEKTRIYKRTSLKRETGVDSVAETVLFLLSEKSASITGTNVHVDCGTI